MDNCDQTKDGFGGQPANRFPSILETVPVLRSESSREFPAQQAKFPGLGYRCQICGAETKTAVGLARHIREVHGYGGLGKHFQK
jgi:hypothetical protein